LFSLPFLKEEKGYMGYKGVSLQGIREKGKEQYPFKKVKGKEQDLYKRVCL